MSGRYPPMEQWEFEVQTVGVTAGNVVTNLIPGAGFRWLVLSGYFELVADGNAANRIFDTRITDGTNILRALNRSATIVAGQTKMVSYDIYGFSGSTAPLNTTSIGLGYPVIIEGVGQFRITITGGLAGDAYSGFLAVLKLKL